MKFHRAIPLGQSWHWRVLPSADHSTGILLDDSLRNVAQVAFAAARFRARRLRCSQRFEQVLMKLFGVSAMRCPHPLQIASLVASACFFGVTHASHTGAYLSWCVAKPF